MFYFHGHVTLKRYSSKEAIYQYMYFGISLLKIFVVFCSSIAIEQNPVKMRKKRAHLFLIQNLNMC